MSDVSGAAAAGTLQLVMQMQQNLASSVASMGAGNHALDAGRQLAALDAAGTATGSAMTQAVDTHL